MKKLILLLLLGLLNSLNTSENIFDKIINININFDNVTAEELYDAVEGFLIGISESHNITNSQCLYIYKKNNSTFIDAITTVLGLLQKKQTFDRVVSDIGLEIITMKGFARNCNLLNAIPLYKTLSGMKFEDLQKFNILNKLLALTDLSDDIYVGFYKATNNYTDKFYHMGRAFGTLFDFSIR